MAGEAGRLIVGRGEAGVLVRVVAGDAGEAARAGAEAGAPGEADWLEALGLREGEAVQRVEVPLGAVAAAAQLIHPFPVPLAGIIDRMVGITALDCFDVAATRSVAR